MDRRKLLARREVFDSLTRFFREALNRSVWVGRFVIMPDHLHLFVRFSQANTGEALGGWIKSLKNSVSKELKGIGVPAPHWQKGFFDHVLRSTESYSEKWRYMVENPVRAGLVVNWTDWPWQGEITPLKPE